MFVQEKLPGECKADIAGYSHVLPGKQKHRPRMDKERQIKGFQTAQRTLPDREKPVIRIPDQALHPRT